MDFGKSFSYIFDDPDWFSKLWKPVLCGLIPFIGGFVLQGYFMNVTKNVVNGQLRPLYHMDFGDELALGFKWFLVQLVYSIPLILITLVFSLIIPVTMGMFDPDANPTNIALSLFGQLGISMISFTLSVVLMFVFPVVSANVAVKGTFASGFEFKEMFEMVKRHFSAWLLVLAGQLVASFIAPLGFLFFMIGVIVSAAYAGLMTAHLAGQAYRESRMPYTPPPNYYPPI